MEESESIDEIGELVEGSDRGVSELCRKWLSDLSNGCADSLCWSCWSIVDSREGVAGDELSWEIAGSSSVC